MKNALIMTLVVASMAMIAKADMSYAPFVFNANDATGAPIADGTYVMVMDVNGNGFGLTQPPVGYDNSASWVWDSSDVLMDRGQISDGCAYPFSYIATSDIPAGYNANQDHYYFLWFNVAYNADATGPGANVAYGVRDLGVVKADPGDYTAYPDAGIASLTTVPEPVSMLVLLIGGGLVAARKRRMCA